MSMEDEDVEITGIASKLLYCPFCGKNGKIDVNWHPTDDAEQCWFLTIYEVIPESYEELVGLVKSYQNTYGAGEILPEIIVDKIIKDS